MRRSISGILLVAAVAAALLVAGCGSSSSSSPLDSTLSYFPKGSAFMMSVTTDPNSPALKAGLAQLRSPTAQLGVDELIARLQEVGISYVDDIQPLFGNPLLIGVSGPGVAGTGPSQYLIAWVTKDAGTLHSLISKLHLQRSTTHDGATLYTESSITFAVDGATIVAGPTASSVIAALDRHAKGDGISTSEYHQEISGVPSNSLIVAFGSLEGALSSPSAAQARQIPWVGALRGYAVAINSSSSGLTVQYKLDTSGPSLTSSELPIAPGATPPALAGSLPIQFGLRDPAATLTFALNAERVSSPAKYAADQARINAVRRKTGVDLYRDVLGQLGNNAAVQSDGHAFMVRIDVKDPATAAQTLRKLGTSALDIGGAHPGVTITLGPHGFETAHRRNQPSVVFGLVGDQFVAGTATPAELRAFATLPETPAPGAHGAAGFRIALPTLLRLALKHAPSGAEQLALSALGDLTGWTASSTSALSGSATLAAKSP